MADDDELHDARAPAAGRGSGRRGPALESWSALDELRADLADGFNLVQHAIVAVNTPKGKPRPKFTPARRPKTAADRALRRQQLQVHEEIVAAVLPSRG
ncbi:hypothetical protein [Pseudonocardia asaccharolytica]|uniref:Uncharacterized protein n=1 Tax=Pseudonocardia asaccharolytica DSM 44247 = NBRC 16224 TaxID=1123024 RepID=A0A511D6X6_9PSEU|nr:hypothetical protein [Pseudonocardia asaccharolytica]GEL19364.1 hypothetical protein PA7_32010 [Pseudonocardia asaccharolytica DSM 44247 = NBRC 16224]